MDPILALAMLGAALVLLTSWPARGRRVRPPERGADSTTAPAVAVPRSLSARFRQLDGVRAFALCGVVAIHICNTFGVPLKGIWVAHSSVPVFFALSAFLLYRPFVEGRWLRRHVSVRRYAWGRIWRIVPGFWVALTLGALWVDLGDVLTLEEAPWHYLMAQIYDSSHNGIGIGVAWSLDVEVTFYVLLALWVLAMRPRRTPRDVRDLVVTELRPIAGLAIVALAWLVMLWAGERPLTHNFISVLPAHGLSFAAGMALAVAYTAVQAGARPPLWLRSAATVPGLWYGMAAAAIVGTVVLNETSPWFAVGKPFGWEGFVQYLLAILIATGLMAPGIFDEGRGGLIAALLASAPARFLARISYGVYLWHTIVILVVVEAGWHQDIPDVPYVLSIVFGSLAMGWLSWQLVERPAIWFGSATGGPRGVVRALSRLTPRGDHRLAEDAA